MHRAQGATVDVAHRFEDGGGRELAYVAMSRARERSTAWVMADDLEQAYEDLAREWSAERRPRWAIDRGTPAVISTAALMHPIVETMERRERLEAERQALLAQILRDSVGELVENARRLAGVERATRNLEAGRGEWRETEVGEAARDLIEIQSARQRAELSADARSFRTRHAANRTARQLAKLEPEATARFEALAAPIRERLLAEHQDLTSTASDLLVKRDARTSWLFQHPEAQHRLSGIERELASMDQGAELTKDADRERGLDHDAEVELPPLPGF